MKSKVFFMAAKNADDIADINGKLKTLLAKSGVLDVARADRKACVKLHFGEEGATGFVRPDHVRVICDEIVGRGAVPVLSDTNTLYRGKRLNPGDHLAVAHAHGFTRDKVGADILIPDDTKKEEVMEVRINQSRIETASVVRFYVDVDAMVVVSHFKGHGLAGFGGAIKNIGMGCSTRAGKLAQHCDAAPAFYAKKCTGCGECALVCPVGALEVENEKAVLDRSKCIGCGSCISACPGGSLLVNLKAGDELVEKMVEYTYAVLRNRQNSSCYLNFALRINQECDCWSFENHQVAPDLGILASLDPVAIDKASFDLVNKACGKDIFKAIHPRPNGPKQLEHAARLGLGSLDYELVEL